MGRKFLYLLSFLALLSTVPGHVTSTPECTARAWVRAPDLVPNTIVQGDARVKISGECPSVDDVALGLRFKERSFVKALRTREDAKLLTPIPLDFSTALSSPWPQIFDDPSRKAREELVANKDRWVVREEERLVFQTVQPFDMGQVYYSGARDAIHDFAILVPATNFPPGLQRPVSGISGEREIIKVQWIYEYFAQVSFSNGTRKDVSAGFTSFHPVYDPDNAMQSQDSETVVDLKASCSMDRPIANYSVQISAGSDLTFFTGAKHHVLHAIISRTGLARIFSAPLSVQVSVMPESSPKWAIKHDIDVSDHIYRVDHYHHTRVLHTMQEVTSEKRVGSTPVFLGSGSHTVAVTMPDSSLEEIQVDEIVTTSSATFTILVELDETRTIADFETYYETLSNSLSIGLSTPTAEGIDPDDPLGGPKVWGQQFEDDEEDWVPWEKMPSRSRMAYWGSVPVVVHPVGEATAEQRCPPPRTTPLDQTILSQDSACKQVAAIRHYLEQGARGPIFVDRSALPSLLAEDPAKRALRAPILDPVVFSPLEGEELVSRYYDWQQIYVGDTWSNKVANKKYRSEYPQHQMVHRSCATNCMS